MAGLGPLTVGITADAQGFGAQAAAEVNRAGPMLAQAGSSVGASIGGAMTAAIGAALATLSIGALASQFQGLVTSGLELATEMQRAGVQAGVAAPQLLLLREAAAQTGADFDLLTDAIQETNLKFGEALNGEASAVDAFSRIGLSVQQLRGMAPEQLFQTVSTALNGMGDSSMRVASAAAIMGDDVGIKVLPMLAGMAVATSDLTARWQMLGAEIDGSVFQGAAGMAQHVDMITATFDRFKVLLAGEMLPYLEVGLAWLDSWIASMGGMGPLAQQAASGFGTIAAYAIDAGQVIYGVYTVVKGLGEIIYNVGQGAVKVFSWMAGEAIENWGEIAAFAGKSLSGIAGTARSIGNAIANFFANLMAKVGNFIVGSFNALIDGFNEVANYLGFDGINRISYQFKGADTSQDNVKSAAEVMGDRLAQAGSDMADTGRNLKDAANAITTDFTGAAQTVMEGGGLIAGVFGAEGAARWSDSFRASVAQAAAATATEVAGAVSGSTRPGGVAVGGGGYIPQVTMSGYNDALTMGGYTGGAFAVPSGFSNAVQGQIPVQQTINLNGTTTAEIAPMLQALKRETVAASVKAVARETTAGGDFRKTIQC